MIKAGIIGGSNPMAGELIRLLIHHPDVEIMWVDSARFTGRLVSDVHHGLLGDTQLRISPSSINTLDNIDVLFIFRHEGQTLEWLQQHTLPADLKVVDLSVDMRLPANAAEHGFVYGLPELNRKALVRGALRTVVPHPAANIIELALLPMAKEGNLPQQTSVKISMPADAEQIADPAQVADEVRAALSELAPTQDMAIDIAPFPADDDRAMMAQVEFESTTDIGEIIRMYEECFEDHNFTFLVNEAPADKEVAGTNKCLMCINKAGGAVRIDLAMDALIKGGAGTAVHDMNLLFGLHEKVGLALKASTF